ncbi:MAG: 4-hydroxy-tetrahydrodipicolinate reductase [Eggerthella lenta]
MGGAVCDAVRAANDMELVCGIDPHRPRSTSPCTRRWRPRSSLGRPMCSSTSPSLPSWPTTARRRFRGSRLRGGPTGLSNETLQELAALAPDGTCLFYAPNFTTGAVLMMEFAKAAAPYFPEAEVIEFHHCNKKDAPSGTAVRTAQIIAEARGGRASEAPGKETEIEGAEGARGALVDGVPVHSVRSMGYVASQEVIFGSLGQTLSIRHDSWDRTSYMPGVLLGIRSVGSCDGLVVGLENFMA